MLIRSILFLCSLLMLQSHNVQASAIETLEKALEDNQGKVVYLDFWASWCSPCRKSFPWMNSMNTKHSDSGFVVISVNIDAEKQFADEFLAEIPANFAVIYDPEGLTARKLKVRGMPASYLFNREGKLVSRHNGFNEEKKVKFEQEILTLLKEK